MQTAYVDESGHETKHWMFVAGFMGNDEQWKRFVPMWKDALGAKKALHMNDLRWSNDRTRRLLARLGPVPDKCGLTAVVGGVKVGDYEDLLRGTPAKKLLKGYVTCIYPLVVNILRSLPRNERLTIVFEQQDEYQPFAECALAAIVSLRNQKPDWFLTDDGLPKLANWSFVPKDSTTCTQPADYFVYALRQLYQDRHSQKTEWCKPILDSGNGQGIGAVMTRKQIRQTVVELPYRAMEAEARRRAGNLEDLTLDAACKKQLLESLDRFLMQESNSDGRGK
jgi:hypothetical protein